VISTSSRTSTRSGRPSEDRLRPRLLPSDASARRRRLSGAAIASRVAQNATVRQQGRTGLAANAAAAGTAADETSAVAEAAAMAAATAHGGIGIAIVTAEQTECRIERWSAGQTAAQIAAGSAELIDLPSDRTWSSAASPGRLTILCARRTVT
jgi:hypothetical protein